MWRPGRRKTAGKIWGERNHQAISPSKMGWYGTIYTVYIYDIHICTLWSLRYVNMWESFKWKLSLKITNFSTGNSWNSSSLSPQVIRVVHGKLLEGTWQFRAMQFPGRGDVRHHRCGRQWWCHWGTVLAPTRWCSWKLAKNICHGDRYLVLIFIFSAEQFLWSSLLFGMVSMIGHECERQL